MPFNSFVFLFLKIMYKFLETTIKSIDIFNDFLLLCNIDNEALLDVGHMIRANHSRKTISFSYFF